MPSLSADPERYSIETVRPVAPSLSIEDRIARIENRLGPETPEEIEHRNRRNREIAQKRTARKPEAPPDEQTSTEIV